MKALPLALLLMASLAIVLMGCSDKSAPVVGPNEQAISPATSLSSLGKSGTEVHQATGSGHLNFAFGSVYNDQWSFNARAADGKCTGQIQYSDKVMGYTFHGEIFQLIGDGKMAKLGWTEKRGPTYPGWESWNYGFVIVVDNGDLCFNLS